MRTENGRSRKGRTMEKQNCGISELLRSIPRYEIEHKCDMSLSLYADKDAEAPECTHRMTANARHNLLKLTLLIGAVSFGFGMIGAVCSSICKK
jgi:hypothetical protein